MDTFFEFVGIIVCSTFVGLFFASVMVNIAKKLTKKEGDNE